MIKKRSIEFWECSRLCKFQIIWYRCSCDMNSNLHWHNTHCIARQFFCSSALWSTYIWNILTSIFLGHNDFDHFGDDVFRYIDNIYSEWCSKSFCISHWIYLSLLTNMDLRVTYSYKMLYSLDTGKITQSSTPKDQKVLLHLL